MKETIEFFKSAAANLPLERTEADFQAFLKSAFKNYLTAIELLSGSDSVTKALKERYDRVNRLCASIENAIGEYFSGMPQKAFQVFDEAMKEIEDNIKWLVVDNVHTSRQLRQLFRIRVAKPSEWHMQKADLFHIPFQDRHKVMRQRYSIPGLPCLYFGGTLYICWLEMDRPSFDSIFVSRFSVARGQTINLLDMGMRPRNIANYLGNKNLAGATTTNELHLDTYILSYAVCWPLIAACSIRRMYFEPPFISEYIVPQLLLQWVTGSKKVDGICYFSVRVDSFSEPSHGTANFVFPAKSVHPKGYCTELANKFEMTDPAAWQMVLDDFTLCMVEEPENIDMQVELIPHRQIGYRHTKFTVVEGKLLNLEASRLQQ